MLLKTVVDRIYSVFQDDGPRRFLKQNFFDFSGIGSIFLGLVSEVFQGKRLPFFIGGFLGFS